MSSLPFSRFLISTIPAQNENQLKNFKPSPCCSKENFLSLTSILKRAPSSGALQEVLVPVLFH
jgi:hypothetical protein